jgi:galactose mutarotase-like enzyme
MLYTIKNDKLEISADTFGAELHSLRLDGKEYLWQCGDAWKRYAPILFPFICSPKNRCYTARGKQYRMNANHGFARDMQFTFKSQTDDSLSFVLTENSESLAQYPYKFALEVKYTINDNCVKVENFVTNTGDDDMYFYLGAHPAFNCPMCDSESFDDYYVEFDQNEHITQTINGKKVTLVGNGTTLDMTRSLFDNDSIPLEFPNSKAISLKSKKGERYVRLEYPVSDCITVWSPTGDDNAKFVCLEPWTSVPTFFDDDFDAIEDKPHAIRLPQGETYTYSYNIKLF